MIWAEPEKEHLREIGRHLTAYARPGSQLVLITSGPLRRFLPEWRQGKTPARGPAAPVALKQFLSRQGWRVEQHLAFHGPRSLGLSSLARLSRAAGRPDWSDRLIFAQRSVYQEAGWLWPLATVSLIKAQKWR
ncbi:MAG: hypothetical protein VB089_02570 [Anaerolineaceae bacterium]|nr:hypothetical protein [Anaerolineaceae bacterium]